MRPAGNVYIEKIVDGFGRNISLDQAVKYKWLSSTSPLPCPYVEKDTKNLYLDQGRQIMAYAFGFRSPIVNYTVQSFGVGTGLTPPAVTDVALESPIVLSDSQTTKTIDAVDFLSPFVVRVAFTLGINDANGYIISEMGLFSGGGALMARKVRVVSINKTSDFSPTLLWRLRFVLPFALTCVSMFGWLSA